MFIGKTEFFEIINKAIEENKISLTPDATTFYQAIMNDEPEEKKNGFTENGKKILAFLKDNSNKPFKSKDIAAGIDISSRSVSGSIRKLVTDGYVEKISKEPCVYMITNKGMEIEINED